MDRRILQPSPIAWPISRPSPMSKPTRKPSATRPPLPARVLRRSPASRSRMDSRRLLSRQLCRQSPLSLAVCDGMEFEYSKVAALGHRDEHRLQRRTQQPSGHGRCSASHFTCYLHNRSVRRFLEPRHHMPRLAQAIPSASSMTMRGPPRSPIGAPEQLVSPSGSPRDLRWRQLHLFAHHRRCRRARRRGRGRRAELAERSRRDCQLQHRCPPQGSWNVSL